MSREVIIPDWKDIKSIYDLRMCLWKLPDDAVIKQFTVRDGRIIAQLFMPAEELKTNVQP